MRVTVGPNWAHLRSKLLLGLMAVCSQFASAVAFLSARNIDARADPCGQLGISACRRGATGPGGAADVEGDAGIVYATVKESMMSFCIRSLLGAKHRHSVEAPCGLCCLVVGESRSP